MNCAFGLDPGAVFVTQVFGDLAVTVDHIGQVFADQFAHFGCLGMGLIDIDQLRGQTIQLHADLIDQLHRRRRQRAALGFQPKLGPTDQCAGVGPGGVKVSPAGHLEAWVLAQQVRCGGTQPQAKHQTGKADPADDRADDHRAKPDRGPGQRDVADFAPEMTGADLGRTLAD
jgi:hypothetical protein